MKKIFYLMFILFSVINFQFNQLSGEHSAELCKQFKLAIDCGDVDEFQGLLNKSNIQEIKEIMSCEEHNLFKYNFHCKKPLFYFIAGFRKRDIISIFEKKEWLDKHTEIFRMLLDFFRRNDEGAEETVRDLLSIDTGFGFTDYLTGTILHQAIYWLHIEILECIFDFFKGRPDIIAFLLNIKNESGKTCLELAQTRLDEKRGKNNLCFRYCEDEKQSLSLEEKIVNLIKSRLVG